MKQLLIGIMSLLSLISPNAEIKHKRMITPIEGDELISVIKESYANVHKKTPEDSVIAGAWAHISLENKHGKRIWNYNFGNIGSLPEEPSAPYYSHFGKAKYRSFDGFVQGGETYWKFMLRCKEALINFRLKNPKGAALSLKRCNYYRSDLDQYSNTLAALYETGIKRIQTHRATR
jgi:hypothetical protein